jgi:hypothetical protein
MRLFKYSRITDYLKENLAKSQIWFSRPTEFNDIDDSSARLDFQVTDEDIMKEMAFAQVALFQQALGRGDLSEEHRMAVDAEHHFNAMLQDRGPDGAPDQSGRMRAAMENALAIRRNRIGISCFCKDAGNNLLWAYYADSFKGLCMEVETAFDDVCFRQLESVVYVDSLPRLKILPHMMEAVISLYTTKTNRWAHENEVRAFQLKWGNYPMDPKCLKSLFFGLRTPPEQIDAIRQIVRVTYADSVAIFRMVRPEAGEMGFVPL